MREVKSFCRVCHAGCGVSLTIDDNDKIVAIRGDKDNKMSNGYACFKGLQSPNAHYSPERLLRSLKRQPDGSHASISSEQALDEIAEKIRVIRERDGPDAIALYAGGGAFFSASALPMLEAFVAGVSTTSFFTPLTIDQPNKYISLDRMGAWHAGVHDLDHAGVVLLLGTNPLISHQAYGLLLADATRRLKAAKSRGMKLICIDPRFTETARHADLFLQPVPGQDPAILAAIIRLVLKENWEDRDFCDRYIGADGMADLVREIDPFTPELVEARAGLKPGQIRSVAEIFARDNKTGPAVMTTGGSFAPFGNLTQHLLDLLNIVSGRQKRAGDYVAVTMIEPPGPIHAEVTPPTRHWEASPPGRIRGVGSFFGQKLTPTLAEEILTPGRGQIKCLISAGGNPVTIVPDQRRMEEAMCALELSVTIDPFFTSTAQLSDYVIAPTMMYERADIPFSIPGFVTSHNSYAQFAPAAVKPPAGSDLIDDWYFFWGLAKRLGMALEYAGVPLDMETAPTTEELLEIRLRGARVQLSELKQYPSGNEFRHPDTIVAKARSESSARFDVMPRDVARELQEFLAIASEPGRYHDNGRDFPFLLTSRRSRHIFNSTLNQITEVRKRIPFNPAYMHPDDMARLALCAGDIIEIDSGHGKILAVLEPESDMRHSVVSMMHGVTSPADEINQVRTNINVLIDTTRNYSAINAMPRMSAIPIDIRRLDARESEAIRIDLHRNNC